MNRVLHSLGFHRRYRAYSHSNLWQCLGCTGLWCQRMSVRGNTWWEKVR